MASGMMIAKTNLNVTNWSLEMGYDKVSNRTTYPFRSFNSGYKGGLQARVQIEKENLNYYCHEHGLGFKLILSVPGDTYQISRQSFQIPLSEDVRLAIKPKQIITSKKLRKYEPNERECFFNDERQLYFFKNYTKNNCEAECLANYTKRECGCVGFYMPRDRKTRICGGEPSMIKCYQTAESNLFRLSNSRKNFGKSFRKKCNCLPACTTIEYDADVSHVKFDLDILPETK